MPTLANYEAIQDSNFEIWALERERVFEFDLPDDIRLDGSGNRPLLCYRVDTVDNATNLRFSVAIRDRTGATTEVSSLTLNDSIIRTMIEVVDFNAVSQGSNRIFFRYEGGNGKVIFSDVVFWYKRRT